MSLIVYQCFYVEGDGQFRGLARLGLALMFIFTALVDVGFFSLTVLLISRLAGYSN